VLVRKLLFVCAAAGLLLAAAALPAFADHRHHDRDHRSSYQSDSWYESDDGDDDEDRDDDDSGDAGDSDGGVAPGGVVPVVTGSERSIQAALTGYSWQDNTPAGSADICCPQLHSKAGGTGTYADPLTTAVAGSGGSMIFKAGTRFYLPPLKRYVIVEDSGASSDDLPHLDVWVGGQGHSKGDSDACMDEFTGNATIIQNPGPGHPVTVGELTTAGGCRI
jgi:hypothetical protein